MTTGMSCFLASGVRDLQQCKRESLNYVSVLAMFKQNYIRHTDSMDYATQHTEHRYVSLVTFWFMF